MGSALLRALAEHCSGRLGLSKVVTGVDDDDPWRSPPVSFVEVDREVEQVRTVGDEPAPTGPPAGVEVIEARQRPDLWSACFETFGKEVLADFALYAPLQISAEQWNTSWRGDPMFLALYDDEVIGCAGLNRDTDLPERAENALTAVRRTCAAAASRHISSAAPCTGLRSTDWKRSTPGRRPATRRCCASTSTSATSPHETASRSPGHFPAHHLTATSSLDR